MARAEKLHASGRSQPRGVGSRRMNAPTKCRSQPSLHESGKQPLPELPERTVDSAGPSPIRAGQLRPASQGGLRPEASKSTASLCSEGRAPLPRMVLPPPFGRRSSSKSGTKDEKEDKRWAEPRTVPIRLQRRVAELLMEIAEAKLGDFLRLGDKVMHFEEHSVEGSKLRRAFRTRGAELLCLMGTQELELAPGILRMLRRMAGLDGVVQGDAQPSTCSTHPTLWQCPANATEERISILVHSSGSKLDALVKCYSAAFTLADEKLIPCTVYDLVLRFLENWIYRVPSQMLVSQLHEVKKLTIVEPTCHSAVEGRLVKRAQERFAPGEMAGYLQLVVKLHGRLGVFDGPGHPRFDQPSGLTIPPLQISILECFRECLKRWPISRLAAEFRSSVLNICKINEEFNAVLAIDVSVRVVSELHNIELMLGRQVDPVRVQEELMAWAQFVRSVGTPSAPVEDPPIPGLFAFEEETLRGLLGSSMEAGSLAFCAARVTPGTPEFPLEYRRRAPDVWKRAKELLCVLADARKFLESKGVRKLEPIEILRPKFKRAFNFNAISDRTAQRFKTYKSALDDIVLGSEYDQSASSESSDGDLAWLWTEKGIRCLQRTGEFESLGCPEAGDGIPRSQMYRKKELKEDECIIGVKEEDEDSDDASSADGRPATRPAYYTEEEEAAAIKIERCFRGRLGRQKVKALREQQARSRTETKDTTDTQESQEEEVTRVKSKTKKVDPKASKMRQIMAADKAREEKNRKQQEEAARKKAEADKKKALISGYLDGK